MFPLYTVAKLCKKQFTAHRMEHFKKAANLWMFPLYL